MMSLRIKEFYELSLVKEPTEWSGDHLVTYFDPEKFAKLIVKDCISEIAMIGVTNSENEDIAWVVDVAIKNIKNRFGVE
jgi:hypothetical protein